MRRHSLIVALLLLTLAVLGTSRLLLADITGKIIGTVTDPTGAVVPQAKVSLRNPSTGLVRQTRTDTTGSYEFLAVPIGDNYIVEIETPGFRKAIQERITLLVNQVYRADAHLQLGTATQTVEVSGETAQVETTSTQLGDVIEDRKMTTLPLNGRSYLDLLGLQTGVVPLTSDAALTGTVSGNLSTGNFSVNGQREASNSFLVNGGDAEQSFQNGAAVVPTLDSIQEFRLVTNSFDAEYGRFSGAMVNVVTKSGTNSLHGDLYEFLRNNALDSRNFFELNQFNAVTGQEIPGSAIGEFRQNQFGGTAGGPILKNRLFFFSDYQGTRQILGSPTGNLAVPSLAERSGDFSDVATSGHAPIGCVSTAASTAGLPCTQADITNGTANVYGVRSDSAPGHLAQTLSSSLGYTVSPGEPYWIPGCNTLADAQAGTCVFPGGVIPQSAWSPAAKGTLQYLPTPSLDVSGVPLFSTSAYKNTLRDDKFGQRIDLSNRRTGNWTFYYFFDDAGVVNPYAGGNVPGFAAANDSRAQQFNASNTQTLGGAAVNEARVNYTRTKVRNGKAIGGLVESLTSLGFAEGGLGLNPAFQGVPAFNPEELGLTFGASIGSATINNTYQVVDNF